MTPAILLRIVLTPVCATLAYVLLDSHPVTAGFALGCAIDAAVGVLMLYANARHPTCGWCALADRIRNNVRAGTR